VHLLEVLEGNSQLAQDFEEQGRANFVSTVQWNGHGSAVGVNPALVAAGLASFCEAKLSGHLLKFAGGGARHE